MGADTHFTCGPYAAVGETPESDEDLRLTADLDSLAQLGTEDEQPAQPGALALKTIKLLCTILGLGAILLVCLVTLGAARSSWRPLSPRNALQQQAEAPPSSELQLWKPPLWHKDWQGNDVKDSWDHFTMPTCDSGPEPGTMIKESAAEKMGAGGKHRKLRASNTTGHWVLAKRTPAQKECAEHKRVANEYHERLISEHWAFVKRRDQIRELHIWQGQHRCKAQLVNTDFDSRISWQDPNGRESPAHCQRVCTWNPGCDGFAWSSWGCFLKRHDLVKKPQAGVYAGFPCKAEEQPYSWPHQEVEKHTMPQPKALQVAAATSMYCTMVILPYSYEIDLALMQYQNYYSIFQCDLWGVYSSQRLDLAPGLVTRIMNTSQVAEKGGQWGTALNTEPFLAFWKAVIQDGDYLKARWFIKVDPDTVWFPARLIPILQQQEAQNLTQEPGVYLNNCPQGLHGPIEVLSQAALSTFAKIAIHCYWSMNDWGNWQWGEDMWLDQCFMNIGHVKRVFVQNLLVEENCAKWPGWQSCPSQGIVAYHPFKQAPAYIACTATGITTSTTMSTTTMTLTTMTSTTVTHTAGPNPVQNVEHWLAGLSH